MQVDVVVAFFLLGVIARLARSDLELPAALYSSLVIFLLLAIGLKGGVALHEHATVALIPQSLAVVLFGLTLPLLAYPLLRHVGELPREDAASIAAHYGSVSIGTYAVAVAVLESRQVSYEAWFPLFVVLLEIPAIAVGIWLARPARDQIRLGKLIHEMFLNQGVLLMLGGLVIGWWAGERAGALMSFFNGLFHGVLALFLLQMGVLAASKAGSILRNGSFLAGFAVFMPLVGAVLGASLASVLGLSTGGTILLATLGASASYIAVPAAMAIAVPAANPGLSIAASLAVTFPFNVLVGIPLYTELGSRFLK